MFSSLERYQTKLWSTSDWPNKWEFLDYYVTSAIEAHASLSTPFSPFIGLPQSKSSTWTSSWKPWVSDLYVAVFFNFIINSTCNLRGIWMTYFMHWTHLTSHFRSSSSHACPFLQQQQQQQHHHASHNRLFHPPTNSNLCPLSMGSTVPLQHHPPHPGPPVIIDVDQMPDHVRAVPVTSLPNSLLVASVPVAAPTYIQPHHPHQVSGVYLRYLYRYVLQLIFGCS